METFAHLFEFLAGINSAYIVSDHFLKSLIEKVFKPFYELDLQTHNCRQVLKYNKSKLIEIAPGLDPADRASLDGNSNGIERRLDILEAEVNTSKSLGGITENFSYLSLFGAMYSILILILIGFEINFHQSYTIGLTFTTFNLLSILLLLWLLVRNNKKWIFKKIKPSYSVVAIIFVLSLTLSGIFAFFIFREYKDVDYKDNFPRYWYLTNCAIAILIPTSHYIYYSIISRSRTRVDVLKKMNTVNEILRDVELFGNSINVHSGYANRRDISITEKT